MSRERIPENLTRTPEDEQFYANATNTLGIAPFMDRAAEISNEIKARFHNIDTDALYKPLYKDSPSFPFDNPAQIAADLQEFERMFGIHGLIPPSVDIEELPEDFEIAYKTRADIYRSLKQLVEISQQYGDFNDKELLHIEDISLALDTLKNLEEYITSPDRTLTDEQLPVFKALHDFVEKGKRIGYIELPTGSGKTVIFSEFIEAFIKGNNRKVLVIEHTQDLVNQTKAEIIKFAGSHPGRFFQHEKDLERQVVVATRQSILIGIQDGTINPDDFDLVIGDEAHELKGEEIGPVLKQFQRATTIGFTATVGNNERDHVRNIFEEEIYSMTIREAINLGMITDYENWHAYVDMSSSKTIELGDIANLVIDNFIGKVGMINCKSIAHAEDQAEVIRHLIQKEIRRLQQEAAIEEQDRNWEAADAMTARIQQLQRTKVAAYHSDYTQLKQRERERLLQEWLRGETQILCQVDTLTAGINNPLVEFVVDTYVRHSRVDLQQVGGRGLRKCDAIPNKICTIVNAIAVDDEDERLGLTFMEIAEGTTPLPSGMKGQSQLTLGGIRQRGQEQDPSTIIELVKAQTVARALTQEIAQTREDAANPHHEAVRVMQLAEDFGLYPQAVTHILRDLLKEFPDLFIQRYQKGGFLVEPIQGRPLLEERLRARKTDVPENMIPFGFGDLLPYAPNLTITIIKKLVYNRFSNNPGFHRAARGRKIGATLEVLEEIISAIQEYAESIIEDQPGLYTTGQLGRELGVSSTWLADRIEQIESERGVPFGRNKYGWSMIDEDTRQRLAREIEYSRRTKETFPHTIDRFTLAEEYGLSPEKISRLLAQMSTDGSLSSDEVQGGGKGGNSPYRFSDNGLQKFMAELERRRIPTGYGQIKTLEVLNIIQERAPEVGFKQQHLKKLIDNLIAQGHEIMREPIQNYAFASDEGRRILYDEIKRLTGIDLNLLQ